MRPHTILTLLFLLSSAAIPGYAAPQIHGREISIQADDMQSFVSNHFPQSKALLGGLIELSTSQPHIALPPGNRMTLSFDLAITSGSGQPAPLGRVELSSALHYDAARQAFFLDHPTLDHFKPAHSGIELDEQTRELLNIWLQDYARHEPVYQLNPALTAMLGNIHLQSSTIANGRLSLTFDRDISLLVPGT
ncbi:DUF1439 domain-containing protein [Xylella taiwanensis]|uniref:DUF1439 domain-containing protein n=1 Tax=Xylella taiwanensis TaxID=1444770 RepID=Z9JJN4_9GAMM|nr:DUF1439 domain-containing protein [Xylella taiwanensis]AXI82696.1 hypothetical protein AB672_01275 [Xylella taiwanensis]EWS78610.1 hypothetical protein AF72_05105 [Xylella taiwanensis]MCD8455694.1 DUF1439 domain-containing protein [Xylella taiwanensis]MCD8458101.1 DUF1439 domain-containing protein [Xylella taiwanensis]MCD8460236.1 DUF1439 domain-containing protein [Xylella taiwanensis]